MTRFGVDLSDFDRSRGPVDVAAMARDGITVLTHKATEGTTTQHKYLATTLNAARAAGIPYLGAYHVVRTPGSYGNGTISAQADYLVAYVNAQVPWWSDFPGWFWQIDLEKWGYDGVAQTYGVQFADLLRQRTSRPAVLYAPRWAYGDTIGGTEPLWSSTYGSNPAVPYRQAYAAAGGDTGPGWTQYSGRVPLLWQYGSRCTVGTQPGCDADAIRDDAAWVRLIEGGTGMDPNGHDIIPQLTNAVALADIWHATVGQTVEGTGQPDDGGRFHTPFRFRQIRDQIAALADPRAALVAALKDPTVVAALAAALPDGVDEATVEHALRTVLGSLAPAS